MINLSIVIPITISRIVDHDIIHAVNLADEIDFVFAQNVHKRDCKIKHGEWLIFISLKDVDMRNGPFDSPQEQQFYICVHPIFLCQ